LKVFELGVFEAWTLFGLVIAVVLGSASLIFYAFTDKS